MVDGAAVEYRQAGRGPDLVLLHSLLTDMSAFAAVEDRLARHRRLTLINLPGYGASDSIAADTVEEYADHVCAVLDALALPDPVDLFGNGFGGFVAASLATRRSGRIGRLIIADALASFPPPAKEPLRMMAQRVETSGMGAVLDAAIGRMFPPAFIESHPGVVAERRAALSAADPAAFARACRALAALDLSPLLGAIRNRTLVMVGALDATTPPSLVERLAGGISNASFRTLADCGHCPMLEVPDAFSAALESFLSEH